MLNLSTYPQSAPGFIADHPAPEAWQRRVQEIDRQLAVAWNPHHAAGPCWSIVRYHGQQTRGVVILRRGGQGTWSTLFKALAAGWSYVKPLLDPDNHPIGLDSGYADVLLADLKRNDLWEKFGKDKGDALPKIEREEVKGAMQRQEAHDTLMHEAFEDAVAGRRSDPPELIVPGAA